MDAFLNLGEVIQLPGFSFVRCVTHLRTTTDERTAHTQRRYRAVAQGFAAVVPKLKAGLVNGEGVEHRGLSYLDILIGCRRRITPGQQIEAADALVLIDCMKIVVTRHQRVPGIKRDIQSRTEVGVSTRRHHGETELSRIK